MARYSTAGDIVNKVAIQVGLDSESDPFVSTNKIMIQLTELLNAAGEELVEYHEWSALKREHTFTTVALTETYALPEDFSYLVEQTSWDRTNNMPLAGPNSSQVWAYLKGSNLASDTIYVSMRENQNLIQVHPADPTPGLVIAFEYISKYWVEDGTTSETKSEITASADVVYFEPILIQRFLKAKCLEARGFDASSARLEFENVFNSRTGKDQGAPILSAGCSSRGTILLNGFKNIGDTNFGV